MPFQGSRAVHSRGDATSGARVDGKSVVGFAERKLALRLNKREHLTSGSRIERVGICKDYTVE